MIVKGYISLVKAEKVRVCFVFKKCPAGVDKGTLKWRSGRYKKQLECIWFLQHNKTQVFSKAQQGHRLM